MHACTVGSSEAVSSRRVLNLIRLLIFAFRRGFTPVAFSMRQPPTSQSNFGESMRGERIVDAGHLMSFRQRDVVRPHGFALHLSRFHKSSIESACVVKRSCCTA
jgi:hypothetical protein